MPFPLPPEVSLLILANLSISSLAAFRQTSKAAASLVASSSDMIYRSIAFRTFPRESSSSATGLSLCQLAPTATFDAEELTRVIAQQHAMGRTYDGCTTWTDFVKRRVILDHNWENGSARIEWRKLSPSLPNGIHRFKLDPEACDGAGAIVTSGVAGGYQAYDAQSGEELWRSADPDSPYPHVELSQGYLVMADDPSINKYTIWRRDTITSPSPLIDSIAAARLVERCSRGASSSIRPKVGYHPFCTFISPGTCYATKFRFPLLVGASTHTQKIYIWDVPVGRLVNTIDISRLFDVGIPAHFDPAINYIELDDEVVYIVGARSVTTWQRDGGVLLDTLPPHRTEHERGDQTGLYRDIAAEIMGRAVLHHGTAGETVVLASEAGLLAWAPRWRELQGDGMRKFENDVYIFHTDERVIQLCVENNRAVFITEDPSGCYALWLLNLDFPGSVSAFMSKPPRPVRTSYRFDECVLAHFSFPQICVCFPLPTFLEPSRVEMTSDAIFVGAQSLFQPGDIPGEAYQSGTLLKRTSLLQPPPTTSPKSESAASVMVDSTFSPKYDQQNGGDIVLVSSDGYRFSVHKTNLSTASHAFKDMLELGSGTPVKTTDEVVLEETRAVLEVILPYIYPDPVVKYELKFPETFSVLKAMDKYDLAWPRRHTTLILVPYSSSTDTAALTVEKARRYYMEIGNTHLTFEDDVYAYLFSTHVGDVDLREYVFKRLIDAQPTVAELLQMASKVQGHFKEEETRELVRPSPLLTLSRKHHNS
ncbi:hypothetical protein P7C70_g6707, partial [Phenoliferia sp. Uapishka_3]